MTGRRLYTFIAFVAIAVGLSVFFLTRNTRHEVRVDDGAAPGANSSGPKVDDTPFNLALPTTTAGPTTIPGGVPSPYEETTTTTTTTTTTIAPTTVPPPTTSTLPTRPLVPQLSSINSVCGMVDTLQSAANVFFDKNVDARSTLTPMSKVLNRFASMSPKEINPDAAVITTLFDQLVATVRSAAWNVSDPTVVQAVAAAQNQTAPFQTLQEHVRKVQFYEAAFCNTGLPSGKFTNSPQPG